MRAAREGALPLRRALLVALLTLSSLPAQAVGAQHDVQLWAESGLRARVHRRVSLDVDTSLRLAENIRVVDRVMQSAAFTFRLTRALRLAAGYRVAFKHRENGDDAWLHRLHVDANARHEVGALRVSYRLRWQETFERGDEPEHELRARVRVALDLGRTLSPYLGTEVFFALADPQPLATTKWRVTVGVSADLDDHELSVFYRLQLPRDRDEAVEHILGLSHAFSVE